MHKRSVLLLATSGVKRQDAVLHNSMCVIDMIVVEMGVTRRTVVGYSKLLLFNKLVY